MPIALSLEAALVGIGLVLFLRGNALPRSRRFAIIALSLLLLAFTVLGMKKPDSTDRSASGPASTGS